MTALERIESIEKSIKSLTDQMGELVSKISTTSSVANLGNSRSLSLEVSLTELAKTLTSVVGELIEAKVVTSDAIMGRMIKMNQEEDDKEINTLKEQNILVASDEIKRYSFVVVSHTVVDLATPDQSRVVMDRRVLRLPTSLVDEQLRSDLVGRKVGDQIQINKSQDGKVHVLTIKEIYDLNEKELVHQGELNGEKPGK